MSFYIGAKIGPDFFNLRPRNFMSSRGLYLPDDKLSQEIRKILDNKSSSYYFHDVVQEKKSFQDIRLVSDKKYQNQMAVKIKADKTKKKDIEQLFFVKEAKKLNEQDDDGVLEKKVAPPKVRSQQLKITLADVLKKQKRVVAVKEKTVANPSENFSDIIDTQKSVQTYPVQAYRLQVGSYSSKKKIEKERKLWSQRGYSTKVVVVDIPGKGKWYRLQIGQFKNLQDVETAQKDIAKKYRQTALVKKI